MAFKTGQYSVKVLITLCRNHAIRINCCRKTVKQTSEVRLEMISLVSSSGFR